MLTLLMFLLSLVFAGSTKTPKQKFPFLGSSGAMSAWFGDPTAARVAYCGRADLRLSTPLLWHDLLHFSPSLFCFSFRHLLHVCFTHMMRVLALVRGRCLAEPCGACSLRAPHEQGLASRDDTINSMMRGLTRWT